MKLTVPLAVSLERKTKEPLVVRLNMNVYRNLHHITNNKAKEKFKQDLAWALTTRFGTLGRAREAFTIQPPYHFRYTLHQAQNRPTDIANVLSIVDKFTCDALAELGFIKDDNHKVISKVTYQYGGVDKLAPRAELEITECLVK
jgi:Holliday junction resolvase RusA-like endonuclease